MRNALLLLSSILFTSPLLAQKPKVAKLPKTATVAVVDSALNNDPYFKPVKWRNIGPYRGGRAVAGTGVVGDPQLYYMGTVGGGIWKTDDAGLRMRLPSRALLSQTALSYGSVIPI